MAISFFRITLHRITFLRKNGIFFFLIYYFFKSVILFPSYIFSLLYELKLLDTENVKAHYVIMKVHDTCFTHWIYVPSSEINITSQYTDSSAATLTRTNTRRQILHITLYIFIHKSLIHPVVFDLI